MSHDTWSLTVTLGCIAILFIFWRVTWRAFRGRRVRSIRFPPGPGSIASSGTFAAIPRPPLPAVVAARRLGRLVEAEAAEAAAAVARRKGLWCQRDDSP